MRRRSGLEARKVCLDTERNALQAFLSDELKIIENASRVRTYLQSEDRSVVMSMIESFVKKVELKNGSVTIHYSIPMPPGGNGKKVGSETLPLNGDQWPMETPVGGKEGPEKAWRPCFSRLRASSVDILLGVRPLLLEIPFPEALPPDSVRWASKLGHIRKLPQMPAPAEVPEAVNRKHPFNGGVPSVDLAIHHLGVHLPDGHQPCSTEHFPEGRRLGGGDHACRIALIPLGYGVDPLEHVKVLFRGPSFCCVDCDGAADQ